MTAKLYDAIFVRGQKFNMAAFKEKHEKVPYAGVLGRDPSPELAPLFRIKERTF